MAYFFLSIVIACIYMCMYIYIFLTLTYSVHVMLRTCMFSGLNTWRWTTKWCVLPWGSLHLLFPLSSVPIVICVELNFVGFSLSSSPCLLVSSLLVSFWRDFYGCSFRHYWETQCHNKLTDPLALTTSLPTLLQFPQSLRCRSVLWMHPFALLLR